jgi:hypothetical protein
MQQLQQQNKLYFKYTHISIVEKDPLKLTRERKHKHDLISVNGYLTADEIILYTG